MADNEKHMDTSTIDYYNRNYDTFVESTRDVDFSEIQNTFMDMLPNKAEILDFGCGSGRDHRRPSHLECDLVSLFSSTHKFLKSRLFVFRHSHHSCMSAFGIFKIFFGVLL